MAGTLRSLERARPPAEGGLPLSALWAPVKCCACAPRAAGGAAIYVNAASLRLRRAPLHRRRLAVSARRGRDFDPAGLALLRLRDPHLEDAVREGRLDPVGVDAVGQGQRTVEAAERALDAVPAALVLLVLRLALARDRERAVLHLDVHVSVGEAGEVGLQDEVVLGLDEVHRRDPAARLLLGLSEEGVEDAVDLTGEGLGLHQKGHVDSPPSLYDGVKDKTLVSVCQVFCREVPVIALGCVSPSSARTVGATSASVPPSRSSPRSALITSGTGFVECAVFGLPSGSSICSALPWSAVTMHTPPASWTASITGPRHSSTVSIAFTAASITPVCPTMSGFAKLMIPKLKSPSRHCSTSASAAACALISGFLS